MVFYSLLVCRLLLAFLCESCLRIWIGFLPGIAGLSADTPSAKGRPAYIYRFGIQISWYRDDGMAIESFSLYTILKLQGRTWLSLTLLQSNAVPIARL